MNKFIFSEQDFKDIILIMIKLVLSLIKEWRSLVKQNGGKFLQKVKLQSKEDINKLSSTNDSLQKSRNLTEVSAHPSTPGLYIDS